MNFDKGDTEMEILLYGVVGLLGLFLGACIFLLALPYIPMAIQLLSNVPNRFRGNAKATSEYEVDHFGFFTSLSPGQVKIIEAGDHFIRCIMKSDGHTFKGLVETAISPNSKEFWEVVSTTDGQYRGAPDADPIPLSGGLISFMINAWSRHVFRLTGYVFVGIYPYRNVRTYRLARLESHTLKNGMVEYEKVEDYSDHFRVKDFQFPVIIPEADTQDKMPVSFQIDVMTRIFNPYAAAYETNDWAQRTEKAVADCVTSYTRPLPLSEVLSAKQQDDGNELALKIKKIGELGGDLTDTTTTYGLTITQVLISDISAVEPSTEMKQKLAAAAIARVDSDAEAIRAEGERKAMFLRAEGQAAQLREQIKAVEENKLVGFAVLAKQRAVETAAAAGEKAIVVVGSGNGGADVDPIQAATLQEIRDIGLRNKLMLHE